MNWPVYEIYVWSCCLYVLFIWDQIGIDIFIQFAALQYFVDCSPLHTAPYQQRSESGLLYFCYQPASGAVLLLIKSGVQLCRDTSEDSESSLQVITTKNLFQKLASSRVCLLHQKPIDFVLQIAPRMSNFFI